jgi:hypothetical protein
MGKVAQFEPHNNSNGPALDRIIYDTKHKIPREIILKIRIAGDLSMNYLSSIFKTTAKKERQY